MDWETELKGESDIDSMWNHFYEKIQEIKDRHIQQRKFKRNSHNKKGRFQVDSQTKEQIRRKHALSRKLVRENNDEIRREYNRVRNKVKSMVKKLKRNFERDLAKKAKKNPKEISSQKEVDEKTTRKFI